MKLVPISSVKEALTIEDVLDLFDASLEAGLHAATETLAAEIRHAFAAVTGQVDNFHIYATTKVGECYRAVLALKQGFVTGTPTLVWAYRHGSLGSGETIPATEYYVDAELGRIVLESGEDYRNRYVRVTYNAGFAADETDPELFAPAAVPDWLQEAATFVAAGNAVMLNPDLQGATQGVGQARDAEKLRAAGLKIAERHLRYFPTSIRPL